MSTATAPLEIGHVALAVRDLAGLTDFYRNALGLSVLTAEPDLVRLGAGERTLLELRGDPALAARNPRDAGLFHTAFLLPSRAALGRWIVHAAETRLPLQGASDHLVSEAIYLSDPEGNGIEVYADRPRDRWPGADGRLKMATDPLDLNALARAADGRWTGAPDGTVVGHVHLQVGDVPQAEAFYAGLLGFEITAHYTGAAFYGSGGYHHHIATNVWNSRGAGQRASGATGLAEVVLLADAVERDAIAARAGATSLPDPWGTLVTVAEKVA